MKKLIILIFFIVISSVAFNQVTIKITSVPQFYTPFLDTIFISGTFNGWNTSDPAYRMIPQPDGTYSISITGISGSFVEYKFTRGTWDVEETQLDGSFLPNRSFTFTDNMTIENQVANWKDQLGWHTSVGNTKILDMDFYIPQLNRYRRVWIYLPQDYYTANNSYPVMYMHDGQNLFDNVYAAFGEWNVDETMESIFSSFSTSAIIVGIDNSVERLNEYSPWYNIDYAVGGLGDEYASFIVNTLKPFIDGYFRTVSDRQHTAIMGSSMGGLISFFAATEYQNIFSKAGIFSPSFWFSDSVYSFIQQRGHQYDMRYYFLSEDNGGTVVENSNKVIDTLLANGFSSNELIHKTVLGANHNEQFWSSEFGDAFKWLFDGITNSKMIDSEKQSIDFYYDSNQNKLVFSDYTNEIHIEVHNTMGQKVFSNKTEKQKVFNFPSLKCGIYLISVRNESMTTSKKVIIR